MSDVNTNNSIPGEILNEGNVILLNGQIAYLRARCGDSSEPAMLELYADGKCQSLLRKIPFKHITKVEYEDDQGKLQFSITKNDDNGITFCAHSVEATKEWIQYGVLLLTIPHYPIAKPPKEMFISQELLTQHSNPKRFGADRVWPVYILHEGIGSVLKLTGLHILTLYYHEYDYQLKFHDLTGKCVLVWDGNKIRRCGYIKSLVFVEAGRRCAGGPGLLWMQHPIPFSTELCECLYKFLKLNLKFKVAPSCCTFTDSMEAAKHLLATTTVQSSCECGDDVPHSTSSTSVDATLRPTEDLTFESNMEKSPTTALRNISHSKSPPSLPPKPQYENVRRVPAGQHNSYKQNNTLPSQPSAAHGPTPIDQCSSHPKYAQKPSRVLSQRRLENKVFLGCSPAIFEKLDVSAILPYLNEKNMLTAKDYQTLINKSSTDFEKIEYLMYVLPRKGDDFFGKFMYCLCMSKPGTGHDDIVKALHNLKAKLEKDNKNNEMGNASDLQGAEEDENEPYPIFIDLPDGVRSIKVKSSQTVSSLIVQLSSKLNIQDDPLEIQVDGEKVSHSEHTLRNSRIHRHSFISLSVGTT